MKTHDNSAVCGGLLLAIGLLIRYLIGRRRFNRRGIAGLQQFPSYGVAVMVRLFETLLLIIGNLCVLGGLSLLALTGCHHPFKF